MKIELHLVQNFAPSCLNRDDVNAPKDCEFGGYRRARISSQCLKRAVRTYWDTQGILADHRAKRTRRLVDEVSKRLMNEGKNPEEARELTELVLAGACGLTVKADGTTEYLLFLGDDAIASLAKAISHHWDDLSPVQSNGKDKGSKSKKKAAAATFPDEVRHAAETVYDGYRAADLALFGRMIADKPDKNVEASCQVGHAISTHRVSMEMDYYTAVDDLQPKEEPGAGMIGTIEFNSACFYRYSLVDWADLNRNLSGDKELAREVLSQYIKATVAAIPSGKQNSMAAHNPPSLVFAVVRDRGTPWSLANAFENPVRPNQQGGGLVVQSIERIGDYWDRLKRCYGDQGIRMATAICLEDIDMKNGITKADDLESLISEVTSALEA